VKVLLALVGIPALLVGLMAMHILSPESEAAPRSHVVVQALTASTEASPAASCDPACATVHDVITFACILALGLVLFLLVPLTASRFGPVVRRLLRAYPARSQLPHTPLSLELLSISRT
jgi:hypothetical protein